MKEKKKTCIDDDKEGCTVSIVPGICLLICMSLPSRLSLLNTLQTLTHTILNSNLYKKKNN